MAGRCVMCSPPRLFPGVEPTHCYGTADKKPPPGVLGGFRCSCECQNWERTEGGAS